MAERRSVLPRVALLIPAALALLLGLDAALLLLGLPAPLRSPTLPDVHGLLLVLGFVGALVALERAVALARWWGFAAPAGLGLGSLLLAAGAPRVLPGLVLLLGALVLVAVYVPLWARSPAAAVVVQAAGAVLATGAALLWLGGVPVPVLLPSWHPRRAGSPSSPSRGRDLPVRDARDGGRRARRTRAVRGGAVAGRA